MAITRRIDLDTGRLRDEIRAIYARVATDPSTGFHFRRGPAYAAERLGYDSTALAALPSDTTLPSQASQIPCGWLRHVTRTTLTQSQLSDSIER